MYCYTVLKLEADLQKTFMLRIVLLDDLLLYSQKTFMLRIVLLDDLLLYMEFLRKGIPENNSLITATLVLRKLLGVIPIELKKDLSKQHVPSDLNKHLPLKHFSSDRKTPECIPCNCPLTIRHLLIECVKAAALYRLL